MISDLEQLYRELRTQRRILEELLRSKRREFSGPRPRPATTREINLGKNVLALLSQSLDRIRLNRNAWSRLSPAQKQDHPEIVELLRENQNLIFKILVLEKERGRGPAEGWQNASERGPAKRNESTHILSRVYRRNSAS